jgi:hypothetical protein
MHTWNTLPESYQQRVYNMTPATVKCHIQRVENPTHAVVISVEAAHVDNAILFHYLTWALVMSTGMRARMVMMWIWIGMRRKKHRKPMMDQDRIWRRTDGIVGDVNGYECDDADVDGEQ